MKKINFYCFSGTGNTLLVADKMAETFKRNEIDVTVNLMEKTKPSKIELDCVIGLAFPVAVFTTYPLVWRFIEAMPNAKGTRVFMVDTMGGFSISVKGALKELLTTKGYKPCAVKEIKMPDNYTPTDEKIYNSSSKILEGLVQAEDFALDILSGQAKWRSVPLLGTLWNKLLLQKFIWDYIGNNDLTLEKTKCIKCSLCSKICPTGNIKMQEYPVFNKTCEMCMRCIAFCPANALSRHNNGRPQYKAVDVGRFL